MHTLELPEKDLVLKIPGTWHEMTVSQRGFCLKYLIWFKFKVISYEQYLVACFYKLAGVKRDWFTYVWESAVGPTIKNRKNANIFMAAEQCVTMHPVDEKREFELVYACECVPFQKTAVRKGWGKRVWLHGPADLLADLTFGEFRMATGEMNEYFSTKTPEHLDRFVACLFRPLRKGLQDLQASEGFDGKHREPFNEHRIGANARLTACMPDWQKMAVLLWFTHCVKVIQREELIINGREICLASLFPDSDSDEDQVVDKSSAGWYGVLTSVAKEGLLGDMEKTDSQDLYTILLYMFDQNRENERLRSKYKNLTGS